MICILKFTKGHNSSKPVGGVTVRIFCTVSDEALYVYHVSKKYLKGVQRKRPEH